MARNLYSASIYKDACGVCVDDNDKTGCQIRCVRMVDFCDGGSYTWTVPTGVTKLTIETWGGGGGGAGVCCCDCYHLSHGGSGGGYTAATIDTVAGCSYTVCVGRGGNEDVTGKLGRHWCCFGKDGETSYVTGYNLSASFCATGGGGAAMNGDGCHMHCGCYSNAPGCGSGGNAYGNGAPGGQAMYSTAEPRSLGYAGGAAFTAGTRVFSRVHCSQCRPGDAGALPGGGGDGPRNYNCCCYQAGNGGTGLVRIRFE